MFKKLLGKIGLSLKFSIMIFLILCLTSIISAGMLYVAFQAGLVSDHLAENSKFIPLIVWFSCIIIGTVLSIFAGRSTLKTVEKFIAASNQLADGDFTARLDVNHPREFKRMADNFNHMAEELGSIEVLRSDFINNFSHEFKTPIVSIKGFAEILKYDDLSQEERQEYLDIVIEEASRLAALAGNVLDLSKIEQQSILTNKQTYNLGEQIRQCILLLDNKISEKDLDLDLRINDYEIQGNKEMMSQVWVNLLDNAIKFTEENGSMHLYMKKREDHILIEISDTGCGITEEALPRIFDKFYQGDTSHATKGNGLGLAMVKKIIKLHNGTITCESIPQKGTTFTISLPCVK